MIRRSLIVIALLASLGIAAIATQDDVRAAIGLSGDRSEIGQPVLAGAEGSIASGASRPLVAQVPVVATVVPVVASGGATGTESRATAPSMGATASMTVALNGEFRDNTSRNPFLASRGGNPAGKADRHAPDPQVLVSSEDASPLSKGQLWSVAALMMLIVVVRRRHANRAL